MRRFAGIFFALMLIPACSWQVSREQAEEHALSAGRMISEINAANTVLRPFKGLGNIRIGYGKIRLSARAAWIADPKAGCLRIEVMGPVGRPSAKLIVSGSSAFFSWYDHGSFQSRTLSKRSLNPLVHIPINVDEFIFFLSGSIPVEAHDRLVVEYSGETARHVAVLKKRWRGIVEKIGFIPGKPGVTDAEVYSWLGGWLGGWFGSRYRVDMIADPDAETGHACSAMTFSHGDARVRIEIDRQWRDVRIPADAFDVGPSAP